MMFDWMFHPRFTTGVVTGVIFGIAARVMMLRTDYRQYPTYPHGRINHLSLGTIAAGLGAVAVPALLDKNYTAVTFLGMAAQQFRDVRSMERETLTKVDALELVPRGATFIEGIAMAFEGRNYLVIFTAFVASLFSIVFQWYWGALAGVAALAIANKLKSGRPISHVANVVPAEVKLDGPNLYVGDIYIMNVGLDDSRTKIAKHGLGLIIVPKNVNARVTLSNLGQRQALLHNVSNILGVYRDSGEPSLVPQAKLDIEDGRVAVFLLPQDRDVEKAKRVLLRSPILESAVRMPTEL